MFLALVTVGLIVSSEAFEESSDDLQVLYLERYGYLEPEFELVGTRSGQKIERAILKFQKLAGLGLTGVLDTKTKDTMESPRCGVKDIEISFAKDEHGDREPFDNRGTILAHAFFPKVRGDVHVDDCG